MNRWGKYYFVVLCIVAWGDHDASVAQDLLTKPGTYYVDREGGLSFDECTGYIEFIHSMTSFGQDPRPAPVVDGPRHLEFKACLGLQMVTLRCVGASPRAEIINTGKECVRPDQVDFVKAVNDLLKGFSKAPKTDAYDGTERDSLDKLLNATE